MTVLWATHRLNGVVSPVSASSTWNELAFQLKDSGARALVTCLPLLSTALRAAEEAGIPKHHIFVCDLPGEAPASRTDNHRLKSTDQLILSGLTAPQLPPLRWSEGQATRQVAFICYSSGTSGRPVSMSRYQSLITKLTMYRKAYWSRITMSSQMSYKYQHSRDAIAVRSKILEM